MNLMVLEVFSESTKYFSKIVPRALLTDLAASSDGIGVKTGYVDISRGLGDSFPHVFITLECRNRYELPFLSFVTRFFKKKKSP